LGEGLGLSAIVFSPLATLKAAFALKAASYVILILKGIPYLLLRYGRLKNHIFPMSNFGVVVQVVNSILAKFGPQ